MIFLLHINFHFSRISEADDGFHERQAEAGGQHGEGHGPGEVDGEDAEERIPLTRKQNAARRRHQLRR